MTALHSGTKLGRYEILSQIGAGGMGEVYQATDAQLNRPVALKFLHADVAADQKRMQRFIQEARAASALNHPNILTVYDIGQTEDGTRFFATEFVNGVTLREHMRRQRLKPGEVLDICIQVASALVAAHQAGIVHRDIKPENIMLRADGYVKVLDFGLAKLAGRAGSSIDTEAATQALVQTDPGAVMGTVAYMSPEQARGEDVDPRTDIWSLGVVLYEMLTGQVPFSGKSVSHTIVAILDEEPAPLARYMTEAPEALQEIVTDALTKDRDARYQTAKQMLAKLQRLRKRLEAGARLDISVTPDSTSRGSEDPVQSASTIGVTSRGGPQSTVSMSQLTTAQTADAARTVPGSSSAEYVAGRIKEHKMGITLALVLLVTVLAGAGYVIYRFTARPNQPPLSFQSAKITRLTTTGKATNAAISPNGKFVVHVQDDGGQQSLWMRQTVTQSNVQIATPAPVSYDSLAFSPDGDFVYYSVSGQQYPERVLFRIPTLGGAPMKILENLDADVISFSPDGGQFAFVRRADGKEISLMIANADGSNERELASVKNPPESLGSPAWSPDGKKIVYGVLNYDSNDEAVYEVQVADGATKQLSPQRWFRVVGLSWMSDGNSLLMLASAEQKFVYQIWQFSYPGAEAHRLTNDLDDYEFMMLTADSKSLAVVKTTWQSNIWVAPMGDAANARLVTSGSGKADLSPAWAPDGSIVYSSNASGNEDLWIVGADGSNQKQLTANSRINRLPTVSPDGRYILFLSDRNGVPHLWRMNLDGSDQRQLTNGALGESESQFSPDGHWIVYRTAQSKERTLWKIASDGSGVPTAISDKESSSPTISPDGKLIAYFFKEAAGAPRRIAVADFASGALIKSFDLSPFSDIPLCWTPNGRALAFVETKNGISNIVAQPIDGGQPKSLTDLKADRIFWFSFSRDGKRIALSRGTQSSDVVLIKDFAKGD
jgi:serine/threonine protein kinase/Tol biopolymer transport system component